MKSYFFIPSNKLKFLTKANQIESDLIILDLEDAIYNSNLEDAIHNILSLNLSSEFFIRIFYPTELSNFSFTYLKQVLNANYYKFILPKVNNLKELEVFISFLNRQDVNIDKIEIVLLVESPSALLNLPALLNFRWVKAVGLGSHDYCASSGMQHNLENLYWARMYILNTAKAFGKEAIDIASMNLTDQKVFEDECLDGISKGFDGKFVIHPWQLKILKTLEQFSNKEIEFAKKVKNHIDSIGGIENFTIANIDGIVVEKPHLNRITQILKLIGNESF